MTDAEFAETFKKLTGHPPFPWQLALYRDWFVAGKFPDSCNLPTGLGKTSVIAVWLIALATAPAGKVPRRLVYVVNRRTVVDQTTTEVVKLRDNLSNVPEVAGVLRAMCATVPDDLNWSPLAISTLRGQFADNREWSADPARPAVICGTVDMIGSRLLFSGYGVGFKLRPLHAGFLGQDALLVHDEAHLEPAFQTLLEAIRAEQKRCNEFHPFRVMELTATSRGGSDVFGLTDEDRENDTVRKRVDAKKAIHLHECKDEKKLADDLADLAVKHKDSGRAVLVFARTVDAVDKIADKLRKAKHKVETLTGTMRGLERDGLVERPTFRRFLPKANIGSETVYLVCTSAGEVGVNISADHLVCDLSPFDSMAQRFGRVNRFGVCPDTRIDVVYPMEFDPKNDMDVRRERTLELLKKLNGNGSPAALGKVHREAMKEGSESGPMSADRTKALREYILSTYSPPPTVLPVSDILFDAWALTTVRGKLPGRPMVEPYLHGLSEYDPPQTAVAWREEVVRLTSGVLARNRLTPEEALELYPLKPHEELSGPTYGKDKVVAQLEKIAARDAKREPDKRLSAWVIDPDDTVTIYTLKELVEKDKQNKPVVTLGGRTVLLPPAAGGLRDGLLDGESPDADDVSDRWYADKAGTVKRRIRLLEGDGNIDETRKAMRLVHRIELATTDADDDTEVKSWLWFTRPDSADEDGSKTAREPITWQHHTDDVTSNATHIADKLLKDWSDLHTALVLAARFHDFGKRREVWQRSIGNPKPANWYAKSGRDPTTGRLWKPIELTDYRHEFGSLLDIESRAEFTDLKDKPEVQDVIRHLIAVHHGYGRPHFPADRVFDPNFNATKTEQAAQTVPQRYARLQRKYGRWGLAYLESLLRAADYAASAAPTPTGGES